MKHIVFRCKHCGALFSDKQLTAIHLQIKHGYHLLQEDLAIKSHFEVLR